MEAHEIHEFSEHVHEAAERSLKNVSILISILAVLVALVTVLGHREHTEATLQQTRASDKWNEYQARKLRVEQLIVTTDLLALQPNENAAAVQQKIADYKAQMTKWNAEQEQAQEAARDFERDVARAESRASHFDLGEAILQIGVILASVTMLTRRAFYLYAAALLGLAGVIIAGTAFFMA